MWRVLLLISLGLNVLEWSHIQQDLYHFAVVHNFVHEDSNSINVRF